MNLGADQAATDEFDRIDDAVAELAADASMYAPAERADALRARVDEILNRMRIFQNSYLPVAVAAPDPDGDLLDEDGYPTETALHRILTFTGTVHELVECVRSLWWSDFITVDDVQNDYGRPIKKVSFVTGGWSGNETLAGALERTLFHMVFWESSSRGGLTIYEVPESSWGMECPWGDPTLTRSPATTSEAVRRA